MMKMCFFLSLSLSFLACNNGHIMRKGKLEVNEIELSNNLNEVIANFYQNLCKKGVPSVRFYSFCEGEIAEIWCTTGWAEMIEGEMPKYYAENDGFIYFVFDKPNIVGKRELFFDEIEELVGIQLEDDFDLPPNTGFPNRWIYRMDYATTDIYSMVDSLSKYFRDGDEDLRKNLESYTGKSICY